MSSFSVAAALAAVPSYPTSPSSSFSSSSSKILLSEEEETFRCGIEVARRELEKQLQQIEESRINSSNNSLETDDSGNGDKRMGEGVDEVEGLRSKLDDLSVERDMYKNEVMRLYQADPSLKQEQDAGAGVSSTAGRLEEALAQIVQLTNEVDLLRKDNKMMLLLSAATAKK